MAQGSQEAGCERTDWDADNYWQWLGGAHEVKLTQSCTVTVAEAVTLELLPDCASIVTPQASVGIGPGGQVNIRGGGATLTIGPDTITSNVDIVAAGISLDHHVHGGVTPGGATTAGPM
jgi:phage baseplate assembly protein gpV